MKPLKEHPSASSAGCLVRGSVLGQEVCCCDPQCYGNILQPLEQQAAPAVLDLDQLVATQSTFEGEGLLSQPGGRSVSPNVRSNPRAGSSPPRLLLGGGGAAEGGHMLMSR